MTTKTIGVVGAGPKGVAIAAKARAINAALGRTALKVILFEANGVGASWSGDNGFTDGNQTLCTPIERDLGFPYASLIGGMTRAQTATLNAEMQRRFSWQSYAIELGFYGDWVARGQPMPRHSNFADYLRWAAQEAECTVIPHHVDSLVFGANRGKWTVVAGTKTRQCHGVVITGGRSSASDKIGGGRDDLSGLVYSASEFWRNSEAITPHLRAAGARNGVVNVAIIGSGAAGATVANDLIRRQFDITQNTQTAVQVTFINRGSGTMRFRHPNFYDDRLFHDETRWDEYTNKEEFVRTVVNRSVWTPLFDEFSHHGFVEFRAMNTRDVVAHHPGGGAQEVTILHDTDADEPVLDDTPYDMVIDARAPNPNWFLSPNADGSTFLPEDAHAHIATLDSLSGSLGEDFAVGSWTGESHSGLHLPMLGAHITPAATNLMALGKMADRILSSYL